MRRGSPRLAAAAAFALLVLGASWGSSSRAAAPGLTGPAPDFTRADLAGKQVHLADYRGKVVLLNFWATWCGPCLKEIPVFAQWQQRIDAEHLQIIGVSMDDEAKAVEKFLKAHPLDYPVVMGDTKLGQLYGGVLGLPLTYLIDANGVIVARYLGGTDLPALEAKIQGLVAGAKH